MKPTRLQEEIQQTKPFRSPGHECTLGVLRTAEVLRQRLAQVVEPHGVTLQQYNVLRILRGASQQRLPTLDIAQRMIERQPGITRMLDRLERKELVARERCREDRRQVLCSITAAGLKLLAKLDAVVDQADTAAVAVLERADQERLIELLDRVRGTAR